MTDIALKNLFKKLNIQKNIPLAQFTTMRVGGPASFFLIANSVEELRLIQLACFEHQLKIHILSGGSNTLFSDRGFMGVVVKLGHFFNQIKEDSNSITVGASVAFAKVTKIAIFKGWSTALGFAGTPGLIGGAIKMNAGSKQGEIGELVESVTAFGQGKKFIFKKPDLEFNYRSNNLDENMIITEAVLKAPPQSIKKPSELLIELDKSRQKRKSTQPNANSAGSFFKNPYPRFAGELIESCKLKGLQYGGAQISTMHANFILNTGQASANDIINLANIAVSTVYEKWGIMLKPEIRLAGDFD